MTVNLVNEQELNKFLTDYISEYNPEVKVSPLMMLSRKFIADNADDKQVSRLSVRRRSSALSGTGNDF